MDATYSLAEHDHRAIGQRLDLFHFQDEAPGMAFWHPRGLALVGVLEAAVRAQLRAQGYDEVRTPQVLRRPIWEASGHWAHFAEGMLRVEDGALKPVSCPGHVQIVQRRVLSWRDLPIRLAEFGVVHRAEPSGSLFGLLRLRQFTQDDGHVFCAPEQAAAEIERFCRSVGPFYRSFGFDAPEVALSTRPADRFGDDAAWDRAEAALADAARAAGLAVVHQPGAGAFYGPKLEFALRDRRGRAWQCGTIQVDLFMPQRFDVRYTAPSGERRHVWMLHRALLGSVERFLGVLLEHHAAALPDWLAPEQVRVLPVSPDQQGYAEAFCEALVGVRARVVGGDGSLGARIADAHAAAVPYVVIVGPREVASWTVSIRAREGRLLRCVDDGVAWLRGRAAPRGGLARASPPS